MFADPFAVLGDNVLKFLFDIKFLTLHTRNHLQTIQMDCRQWQGKGVREGGKGRIFPLFSSTFRPSPLYTKPLHIAL